MGLTRQLLRAISPRHRRWYRLLDSLTYVPQGDEAELDTGDFIICGCPRTGTTLLTAQLFRPPDLITVMEPWDGLRVPPAELFASVRREIQETGRLSRGRLDITALRKGGKVAWVSEADQDTSIAVDEDFQLGIKWPAFWQYLELLSDSRFLVCLRNPVEVVQSFAREGGRLAKGYDYDVPFNDGMNEALADRRDCLERKIAMYDYINARILPHLGRPDVLAVRYERWFEDPAGLLTEVSAFLELDQPLESQVEVQRPDAFDPDPEIVRAVRRWCGTAEPLGYPVR